VHLKLAREKSSATEPVWVELSDYSSLSSSDNDYSEPETPEPAAATNPFLFTNVRQPLRRRLRRRTLRVSKFKNLVRKVRPASAGHTLTLLLKVHKREKFFGSDSEFFTIL
jgi:hypothetical protein